MAPVMPAPMTSTSQRVSLDRRLSESATARAVARSNDQIEGFVSG
jgi:hypothetical protein